ncbi:MAG TPA: hypothetical protein DEP84_00100, partial [Chloroflexi bacterium]|nr:hypothetical protein [Chloroflexota bacterium]
MPLGLSLRTKLIFLVMLPLLISFVLMGAAGVRIARHYLSPFDALVPLAPSMKTTFARIALAHLAWILILAAGILTLALSVTILVATRLIRPLKALREAASRIADGDLESAVPLSGSAEIADLALALERMRLSLRSTLNLEAERAAEAHRVGEQTALVAFSQQLLATTDEQTLLTTAVIAAAEFLRADASALVLRAAGRDGTQKLVVRAAYGYPPWFVGQALAEGVGSQTGYTLLRQQPVIVEEYAREARFQVAPIVLEEGVTSGVSVPMIHAGETIGALHVNTRPRRSFSEADVRLLSLVANQTAIALDKAWLLAEAHKRVEELTRLNEITRAALSTQDFHTMLQTLADRLGKLIDADGCYITLWDEARQAVIPVAASGSLSQIYPTMPRQPRETTMTESVLQAGHVLVAEDVFNSPHLSPEIAAQFPARSLIGLPLISVHHKLGAALIAFNERHSFTPDELARCERAAGQVALAVAQAHLLEAEQRQRRLAETLRDIAITLNSTLDLAEILERLLEGLGQVIPFDSSAVMLLEEDDHYRVMAGRGFPNPEIVQQLRVPVAADPLFNEIKTAGRAVVLRDAQADPRFQSFGNTTYVRAWIGVPLLSRGEVIGHLTINNRLPGVYGEPEAEIAFTFASQAVTAIENARLYTEARTRAAELSRLYTAAQDLAASLEPPIVLEKLARHLARALDATSSHVMEADLERATITVLAEYWTAAATAAERNSDLGRTYSLHDFPLSVRALTSGTVLGAQTDDASIGVAGGQHLIEYDVKSALLIPIVLHGKALGLAEVWESRRTRRFTPAERRLAQTLVQHAGSVIENARLYASEKLRTRELDALHTATAALLTTLDLEPLLDQILAAAIEAIPAAEKGMLLLLDPKAGQPHMRASRGYTDPRIQTFSWAGTRGYAAKAAQARRPLLIPDARADASIRYEGDIPEVLAIQSAIVVPLLLGEQALGALAL